MKEFQNIDKRMPYTEREDYVEQLISQTTERTISLSKRRTTTLRKYRITAIAAAVIARKMRFSIWSVALAVLSYQIIGMTFEFIMTGDFFYALQDVRIGWPGIAIQIVGGYFLLKAIEKW